MPPQLPWLMTLQQDNGMAQLPSAPNPRQWDFTAWHVGHPLDAMVACSYVVLVDKSDLL